MYVIIFLKNRYIWFYVNFDISVEKHFCKKNSQSNYARLLCVAPIMAFVASKPHYASESLHNWSWCTHHLSGHSNHFHYTLKQRCVLRNPIQMCMNMCVRVWFLQIIFSFFWYAYNLTDKTVLSLDDNNKPSRWFLPEQFCSVFSVDSACTCESLAASMAQATEN